MKKPRTQAAAAIARKLAVSIWHLLKGHDTLLEEAGAHLFNKLLKLSTMIGKTGLEALGFENRASFVDAQIKQIQLTT